MVISDQDGELRFVGGDDEVQLWAEFRVALRDLSQVDPVRARLYLKEATSSLRAWTRGIPTQRDRGADR